MKTVKEGLFWFVMFYVVIISFLFIRQAFIVHDTMYKEIVLEDNEKYETFISESKAKLVEYRSLSTTQEELNCLNEVEKAINISYKNQHPTANTYKELKQYYYKMAENGLQWNNYSNVKKVCDSENLDEERYKGLTNYLMGNIAIIEGYFIETNFIFVPKISISSLITNYLELVTRPSLENMLLRSEQDLRSRIINNDINYINSVLEMVGEKYEVE